MLLMDSLVFDMAEEGISEFEDISMETAKTEKQKVNRLKRTEYSRSVGEWKKCNIHIMGNSEWEKGKW